MTKNESTITWRVGQLECNYKDINTKLQAVLENHLPHIQTEVSSLKTRINVLSIINVGAIILGLLVNRFF